MNLKLYGILADKYEVPDVAIGAVNVLQLISIINLWYPDLPVTLSKLDSVIVVLECDGHFRCLSKDDLKEDITKYDTVHLIPSINGSGEVIAVALLGVAAAPAAVAIVGAIINIAISLIISAIAQALAPKPDMSSTNTGSPDDIPSHMFNGAVNVTDEGYPVSFNIGRMRLGGIVLSSGLYVEEIPV